MSAMHRESPGAIGEFMPAKFNSSLTPRIRDSPSGCQIRNLQLGRDRQQTLIPCIKLA